MSEGSLFGDYQAYLHDARSKIASCTAATSVWTYPYDGESPPHTGMECYTHHFKLILFSYFYLKIVLMGVTFFNWTNIDIQYLGLLFEIRLNISEVTKN